MSCPVRLSRHEAYASGVPHALFAELRRTDPVCWHEAEGEPGFWAVFRYRDIVDISTDTDSFSSASGVFVEDIASGQGIPGAVLTSDPPEHGRLRSHLNPWFHPDAISKIEPWLREQTRRIMAQARLRDTNEFVYDMAARLPLLTICEIMGVPDADRDHMLELGDAVIQSRDDITFARAMAQIGDYGLRLSDPSSGARMSPLVASLRRSLAQDDREFAGQFAQLLVAGNETTRTLLSNIMLELCARADIFAELKAHPDRLPLAIEEFLRWTSPIYYMRRTARGDRMLGGQQIRAGDAVVMYYVSANRDEAVFAEPDRLDIHRKPNRHLAFGVGRHNCLGAQLARMEARIFLEELFAHFDTVSLVGEAVRMPSNVVNGWASIPVRFAPA